MIVRQLDENGDWTLGNSLNNYLTGKDAIGQNIKTRLKEYLGDCFFALQAGIAWDVRLGKKEQEELLNSDVYRIIKNTDGVLGIINHQMVVKNRIATIQTHVQTVDDTLKVEVING